MYSIVNNNTYASTIAKYLLSQYGDFSWNDEYYAINPASEERRANENTIIKNNQPISIYPNPSSEILNIDISDFENSVLTISDLTGKILYSRILEQKENNLSLSQFQNGIYLVKIENDGIIYINKLIINK